jgi:hypothetical protein
MGIKLLLISILAVVVLSIGLPSVKAYDPLGTACNANSTAAKSPACNQKNDQISSNTNPIVNTIHEVANFIALVAGIVAVIVIIISGFNYVTAGGAVGGQRGGDPNKAKSARSSLIGAVIGLLIIVFAWSIITFLTGALIK